MTLFLPQSPNFPRLHQSTANTLLNQCPRAAWYYHADLGGHEKPGSAATKRGNVLDRMIFGVGPEIVVLDFGDYKSKAAQAARLEAEAAGKLPVLLEPYEKHRLFVEAGVPEDSAEFAMLTGIYSEFNGIEVFNDPSDYIRNWIGLDLHTKLLAEITETGTASGGKKPTGGTA